MIKTIRVKGRATPDVDQQIAAMAAEYMQDLSLTGWCVDKANPLHGLYVAMLLVEIGTHIQAMGIPGAPKVSLFVAADEDKPNEILGFVLCMPIDGRPDECGISYAAVKTSHRRRGIFTAMLQELGNHFPKASLSCPMNLVPMYEAFGYKVTGNREAHITMNNGSLPGGRMPVFNPDHFEDHPFVLEAKAQAIGQHGINGVITSLIKNTQENEAGAESARNFAQERMRAYAN